MKKNQYRIVFHTDRGYGMIIAVGMKDITVQYEDGSCETTSPINPDLVILPRFGEMIRVRDYFGVCGVERMYMGYTPNNHYHIITDSNVYKHFSFIDEPAEAKPASDGWTYPTKDSMLPDDFVPENYEVEVGYVTPHLWSRIIGDAKNFADIEQYIREGTLYRYRKIEKPALHPAPEITTEHINAVLRYLTDHFKEDTK